MKDTPTGIERWEPRRTPIDIARHHLKHRLAHRPALRKMGPPQSKAEAAQYHRRRFAKALRQGQIALKVVANERLDPNVADHQTLRITFEGESDRPVHPNDFLSIRWQNDPALVAGVLERLGERPDKQVRIASLSNPVFPGSMVTTSLRAALTHHIELQTCSTPLLNRFGFQDVAEHNAAEMTRAAAYKAQATGEASPGEADWREDSRGVSALSLLDWLNGRNRRERARELLQQQDRILLRPYTMSSFERLDGHRFRASITVSVVQKTLLDAHRDRRPATGRASAFLAGLRPGDMTTGYVLPDQRLFPQTLGRQAPLIIICTGAGIAGPMALLRAGYTGGPLWVIYGVRSWEDHSLYGAELQSYAEAGIIDRLDIAESRPQSATTPKRYVQDVLAQAPDSLMAWLRGGAHVFLSGRLSMGVAVNRTVRDLLVRTGECGSTAEADERLRDWYDSLRFQASVSRV